MALFGAIGHDPAGNHMETGPVCWLTQGDEHLKLVLCDEFLALIVQEPLSSRRLVRLALDGDRPCAILIRGKDVDATGVPERD